MLITCVILMKIDVVMHGQGWVTWRTTRFFLEKSFVSHFVFVLGLLFWLWRFNVFGLRLLKLYGANAQNTYRRIHKSYCSWPIHTKRCYWAVFLERIESWTLESHESLVCLESHESRVCLVYLVYLNTNGNNFTIRKVNLMYVFIVVVWIFLFNKYMIQNPVFFTGIPVVA